MARVFYTINYVPRGLRRMLTGLSEYYLGEFNALGIGANPVEFIVYDFGQKHKLVVDFSRISKARRQKVLDSLETILAKLEIEFKKQK